VYYILKQFFDINIDYETSFTTDICYQLLSYLSKALVVESMFASYRVHHPEFNHINFAYIIRTILIVTLVAYDFETVVSQLRSCTTVIPDFNMIVPQLSTTITDTQLLHVIIYPPKASCCVATFSGIKTK